MRSGLLILLDLASLAVFAFGLIAPSTPSAGLPRVADLVLFVAVPTALLGLVGYLADSRLVKLVALLQIMLILSFEAWLLVLQARIT